MENALIPTAYSLPPAEWGIAVYPWALRFPSSPLLLSLNPGVSISLPIRMILLITAPDLAPLFCSPRLLHPHRVREPSLPSGGRHPPQGAVLSLIYDSRSSACWGKSLYQDEKSVVGAEQGLLLAPRALLHIPKAVIFTSRQDRTWVMWREMTKYWTGVWFALHLFSYAFQDFAAGRGGEQCRV